MTITERRVGPVTVVDLAGKLTLTNNPGLLKDVVTNLVFRGQQHIVLNLADVSYIDSSGLGELVACYLTTARGGGVIKLASAGPRVLNLLVMTKLLTIFESHDTDEAAILSFAGAAV